MKGYEFGIKAPEELEVTQWWGARAIYKPNDKWRKIDIPYDRQSHGESEHTQKFKDFINSFISKLDKECKLASDSNEEFRHKAHGFVGVANPKGSYGYLYMGCWNE